MREVRNSIAHLPRRPNVEGMPPSKRNFVVEAFADTWLANYEAEGRNKKDLAIPEAGPFRGSMASMRCDREVYYALTGVDKSNPPTVAEHWRWWLGQIVHEQLQPTIVAMFPGAAEKEHDLRKIGIPGSSHSDLEIVIESDGEPTLVEIKTVNGFKFKMMATRFNGPPEGPPYGAVMQALMSAKAEGIDRVVIVQLSLENLSPSLAAQFSSSDAGRFAAEWHFTVSELEPQIEAEIRRINQIMRHVKAGEAPERELHDPEYPVGAVITNPTAKPHATWQLFEANTHEGTVGTIIDTGTYWGCNYCPWQTHCKGEMDADNDS
jgi:hypothetical protein